MLHLQSGAQAHARRVVENDEVDVGGVVELEGAVLAHGQHDVARGIGRQPIALGARLAEQEMHGGGYGGIGRFRQAARDRHHRPDAAEIAQGGEKRDVGLEQAQRAHGFGHGCGGGDRGRHLADQGGEALLRERRQAPRCRLAGLRSISSVR